jgi:4-hydroxy-3-methylbut-2-enyl diphosphate reductase
MKRFDIPSFYRSSIVSRIKNSRLSLDPRKKDFQPSVLDFGPVRFLIARHFGFCYGVENAIEIAYKTIEENPGRRIYLLSEMIHNPGVNKDLVDLGVKFIMDTKGNQLIDWAELSPEDIVIIPAFGTTLEIEEKLNHIGINPYQFNTTCPFVEKVWHRSIQLGKDAYTIIIHGKNYHEETRATFSHSIMNAPSLIIRNIEETKFLSMVILGEKSPEEFHEYFGGRYSDNFNVDEDLKRIGVVNQTTMLATETEEIADYLKETMIKKFSPRNLRDHFADTRDTLCYATYENQEATNALLNESADFAIVAGGYNSSNTGHLVELCREKISTYFISSAEKIISKNEICHFDIQSKREIKTSGYFPDKDLSTVLLTSGSSCPDAVVDQIIQKIVSFFNNTKSIEEVLEEYNLR